MTREEREVSKCEGRSLPMCYKVAVVSYRLISVEGH